MPNYRMDRTSEDIMRELTAILRTVKDPRVSGSLLSIVRVDVTRDLSYATVYISSMSGLDTAKEASLLITVFPLNSRFLSFFIRCFFNFHQLQYQL